MTSKDTHLNRLSVLLFRVEESLGSIMCLISDRQLKILNVADMYFMKHSRPYAFTRHFLAFSLQRVNLDMDL